MQDPDIVFNALGLKRGDIFLDAGCGLGEYALKAANLVGPTGSVHAFDVTPGCVEALANQAAQQCLCHLQAQVADITRPLPLPDASISTCLIATVLHVPAVCQVMESVFKEMHRVLRPGGMLGVIECNRHSPYGPPPPLRLDAKQITQATEKCGFGTVGITDMGLNYLALFQKQLA
ncbi:MAG: methyltransferase domain-containing protein [Desulfocurvibacter africanus]